MKKIIIGMALAIFSSIALAVTPMQPEIIQMGQLQAFLAEAEKSAKASRVVDEVCIASSVGRLEGKEEFHVVVAPPDCQQFYLPGNWSSFEHHAKTRMGQLVYLALEHPPLPQVKPKVVNVIRWTSPRQFDVVMVLSEKPTILTVGKAIVRTSPRSPLEFQATVLDEASFTTIKTTACTTSGCRTEEVYSGDGFATLDRGLDVYRGSVVSAQYGDESYIVGLTVGPNIIITIRGLMEDLRTVGIGLAGFGGGRG